MNKREIDLLEALNSKRIPTQRELADETGMSLGMVNNLIKKCAKKGLLKIEKVSRKNIRYLLTPAGLKKISERSLNYIIRSYRAIKVLTSELLERAEIDCDAESNIYLYGAKDEIYELVKTVLVDNGINFEVIDDLEEFGELSDGIIYYWDPDILEELERIDAEVFNIVS